jgi:hypothetical protein
MLESHASTPLRPFVPRSPSEDQLSFEVRIAIAEFAMPVYASEAPNRAGT